MPKYLVASNLNHDNVEYLPGSTVELEEEVAAGLLLVGTLVNIDLEENKSPTLKADEKIELIQKAETVDQVKEILGDDPRKTVVAAADKKIAELEKA